MVTLYDSLPSLNFFDTEANGSCRFEKGATLFLQGKDYTVSYLGAPSLGPPFGYFNALLGPKMLSHHALRRRSERAGDPQSPKKIQDYMKITF